MMNAGEKIPLEIEASLFCLLRILLYFLPGTGNVCAGTYKYLKKDNVAMEQDYRHPPSACVTGVNHIFPRNPHSKNSKKRRLLPLLKPLYVRNHPPNRRLLPTFNQRNILHLKGRILIALLLCGRENFFHLSPNRFGMLIAMEIHYELQTTAKMINF